MPVVELDPRVQVEVRFAYRAFTDAIVEMRTARGQLKAILKRVGAYRSSVNLLSRKLPRPDYLVKLMTLQRQAFNASAAQRYQQLADDAKKSLTLLKASTNQTAALSVLHGIVTAGKISEAMLVFRGISSQAEGISRGVKKLLERKDALANVTAPAANAHSRFHHGKNTEAGFETAKASAGSLAAMGKLNKDLTAVVSLAEALYKLEAGKGSTWDKKMAFLGKIFQAIESLATSLTVAIPKCETLGIAAELFKPLTNLSEAIENFLKSRDEFNRAKRQWKGHRTVANHCDQTQRMAIQLSRQQPQKLPFDVSGIDEQFNESIRRAATALRGSKLNAADAALWSKLLTDAQAKIQMQTRALRLEAKRRQDRQIADMRALPIAFNKFLQAEEYLFNNLGSFLKHVKPEHFGRHKAKYTQFIEAACLEIQENCQPKHMGIVLLHAN